MTVSIQSCIVQDENVDNSPCRIEMIQNEGTELFHDTIEDKKVLNVQYHGKSIVLV
jgi:hypothetical protein